MTKKVIALEYELTYQECRALHDAMRRFVLSGAATNGESLTTAVIHEPSQDAREEARAMIDDGYLKEVGPGRHFVLTEKGAAIVQWWMDCGYHSRCSEQEPDREILKPWTHMRNTQIPPLRAKVTVKQMARLQKFMPGGVPKKIRCYDNGGRTADRYTAVFTGVYRHKTGGVFWDLSMSREPFHPQGIGMSGESRTQIDRPTSSHLGKRVKDFSKLPKEVQQCVRQTYVYLWDIHTPYTRKD